MFITKTNLYPPAKSKQNLGSNDNMPSHIPLSSLILGANDIVEIKDKIEKTNENIDKEKQKSKPNSSFLKELEKYLKRLKRQLEKAEDNSTI